MVGSTPAVQLLKLKGLLCAIAEGFGGRAVAQGVSLESYKLTLFEKAGVPSPLVVVI